MTYGLRFQIKDGKPDTDTMESWGDLPDGTVEVTGYNESKSEGLNAKFGGLNAGAYRDKTMDPKDE